MPPARLFVAVTCVLPILVAGGCHRPEETLLPGPAKLSIEGGDSYAVLAIKADGSNYTMLAPGYGRQLELRWSPDGKKLVWAGLAWGNWDLYGVTADGLVRKSMSDDAPPDFSPSWSGDSKKVADCVHMDKEHTKSEVLVTDWDTPARESIIKDDVPHGSVDWAKAGAKLIAFTTKGKDGWIVETSKPDGQDRQQIAGPFAVAGKLSWSPDGSQIALVTGTSLQIIPAAGGNARAIAQDALEDAAPRWSPDGSMIAIRVKPGYAVLKAADGSAVATTLPAPGGGTDPTWASNGKQIAFSSMLASDNSLLVLEVATKQVTTLASAEGRLLDPAWSPDGKTLAVGYAPPGYAEKDTQ